MTGFMREGFAGLLVAYRYAIGRRGLAFASPQIAFVAALVIAYGCGVLIARGEVGSNFAMIVLAAAIGIAGALTGIAVRWRRRGIDEPAEPWAPVGHWLPLVGVALIAIGMVAMALYLWRIGGIPLFMASAEAGRVDASERGGAALRVLSLLSLPGVWMFVAYAAWMRRWRGVAIAVTLVAAVATVQVLTANRSPAFQTIVVATLVGLLASGKDRLRLVGLLALASFALTLVIAAGLVGAVRLGSISYLGPPLPGESTFTGPPRNYPKLAVIAIRGYAVVPIRNTAYTLEAVPDHIGWRLGFTYVQPILTVLPGKQTTFDQDLKAALGQTFAGGGTVPSLLGEAYANFGPLGWALVPLVVAWTVSWLFQSAIRFQRPALWALYAFAIFHACSASVSGLFVASVFPYAAYAILGVAAAYDVAGSPARHFRGRRGPATTSTGA